MNRAPLRDQRRPGGGWNVPRLLLILLLMLALVWLGWRYLLQPSVPIEGPATPAAVAAPTYAAPTPVTPATAPAAAGRPLPTSPVPLATPRAGDRMATIQYDRLPVEAQATLRLIAARGPFPYRQDGATFQNREGLLPRQPGGYYKEYTVETPGSPDRGARRLIVGRGNEVYYTADHYASFRRVTP